MTGHRLREWRKSIRLSQRAAAKLFECSLGTIQYLENGDRTPGIRIALAIQTVTGIRVAEWVKAAS
jgi:transcriptional regulator with XRE-family HTH domain